MRRRFFVEKFEGHSAVMEGEAAHHVARVLRAQVGQQYELSDGATVWLGRIEKLDRDLVEFHLVEPLPENSPKLKITLLLSVVKFDAFEWALEKATELGVTRIVPLAAARSEKGLLSAVAKRSERWRKILLESSQQCRRVKLPVLDSLSTPVAAFSLPGDLRIILSESSAAKPLKEALSAAVSDSATLAIGPEGGWIDEEFAAARRASFCEASLGKLILRSETAVIAALAALNFALSSD